MKVTIEVQHPDELSDLITWLETRPFSSQINVINHSTEPAPIQSGDPQIDPTGLFGIWKDNPRTLAQIREAAWGDSQ
jgi:hypothetical protein